MAAVRAELVAADRLDTSLGQAALALAGRIQAGRDSAAGLAALMKELRATLAEATRGAAAAASRVGNYQDELAARRKRA